uniref:Killer cell lectin like receptor K1 n=2 Tax=Sus scrofa TaxID=9823 RepID=F1SQ26_PIG
MNRHNYKMGLVRDRWAPSSMEIRELHNRDVINRGAFKSRQKRTQTLITSKCGENPSPFFLARSIAIAMGIRFIVMVMIYSGMIINCK